MGYFVGTRCFSSSYQFRTISIRAAVALAVSARSDGSRAVKIFPSGVMSWFRGVTVLVFETNPPGIGVGVPNVKLGRVVRSTAERRLPPGKKRIFFPSGDQSGW